MTPAPPKRNESRQALAMLLDCPESMAVQIAGERLVKLQRHSRPTSLRLVRELRLGIDRAQGGG